MVVHKRRLDKRRQHLIVEESLEIVKSSLHLWRWRRNVDRIRDCRSGRGYEVLAPEEPSRGLIRATDTLHQMFV